MLLINRESDLTVCGEAADAHTRSMHALSATRPDILVVDISLNGPDGLDLLKDIRSRLSRHASADFSMHDESIYAERALRAGAQGYIMKEEATEKVLVALRRILSQEIYVSERIANRMLHRYIGNPGPAGLRPLQILPTENWKSFGLLVRAIPRGGSRRSCTSA